MLAALSITASAPGITLYSGSYATDMSSSTPTGLFPATGAALAYPTSDLQLSWEHVPGANQYQLQIARQKATNADCAHDGAFQLDNIVLTTTTTQNEWVPTLTTSADGKDVWVGSYCWRVRTTGKGYGDWSIANRFTRTWASAITGLRFYNDHDGAVPRSSSAPDYATGSAVTRNAGYVTWNDLAGASSYQVQVASSQSFARESIITTREGITDNKTILLHLPDDTYYWRVRGVAPNGTEGGWSTGSNAFTVRWQDSAWSDDSRLYPADSSTQGEYRIGWTPMPGASYYEVQAGTSAGCFWNPDTPGLAPSAYGAWVNFPALYHPTTGIYLSSYDPQPGQCRLTEIRQTTINTWMTYDELISSEARLNIGKDCYDEVEGKVLCEPAVLPTTGSKNYGAIFTGANETAGSSDDGALGNAEQIYWRVRPVYKVTQESETGWQVSDGGLTAYGSWTKYTTGGANRHHKFEVDPTGSATASVGVRCEGAYNPGSECVEHSGSSIDASETLGEAKAFDMRFPVFTWKRFAGAGGYIFELARDPLFNNIASTKVVGAGFQQSLAYTHSFPDNSEDTGFWWRTVPCHWEYDSSGRPTRCMPIYAGSSAGLPSSYGLPGGYVDNGVAQTFMKQSDMQVSVVENFEGASPLIRWTKEGVTASDYPGWSQGLPGANHYELELARDPFFNNNKITIKTTIARAVPIRTGDAKGKNLQLLDGLWYFRVRAIDENNLAGSWSSTQTFNKRVAAPIPVGANAGSGPGVLATWAPVEGADSYEIQWTEDSGFETQPSSATTLQTSYRIPDSDLGRRYWRVRAMIGDVKGQWSGELRWVDIVPATTIRYGLNRDRNLAGDTVQITGELKVAGAATNNERLRLQRKTGGCDSRSGIYVDSGVGLTGDSADDGMVNVKAKVVQNTCFRFAWSSGFHTHYSSPIPVSVVPNVKVTKNRKVVRRSKSVCIVIRSNVAISGRYRFQYRAGKTWKTARSGMMRGQKIARSCTKFTKAGRFPTRVVFDKMNKSSEGWKQFDDVSKGMGTIRVNDVWRIVRSR